MRLIFLVSFVLCSLGLKAQTTETLVADTVNRDSTAVYKDPFYLQLYIGINKSANENLPWTEFSGYPWSTGIFIGLGREVTPLWGWRAALRINRNKSRNVPECESKDIWRWSNTGLFLDGTFDITDLLHKSHKRKNKVMDAVDDDNWYAEEEPSPIPTPTRAIVNPYTPAPPKFNLKAFAGVGLAYTWNFDNVPLSYSHPYSRSSKLVPGIRAGLTATWRLTDRWRFGTELSQTFFGDHFNGVAYDAPLDTRTNLKIGLTYLFLKKKRMPVRPIVRKIRLKEIPELPLIMPDPEEEKLRKIEGHAFLDFPVNETVIYPDYRKNPEELARINKSVDSALFDKSVEITRISLHGYASPESPYSNNTRLAKGRTEALKSYLIRNYNFDSKVFNNTYTPEDWENLKGFLIDSKTRKVKGDFWYDNKNYVETPEVPDYVKENRNELLRVIGKNMDPDAKEELLKRVGGGEPYRWLLQYVYPGLRHTDYIIEYKIRPFSVEKGRKLIYSHPEGLSLEEMYKVAMSYDQGTENWLDALLIAARRYPNNQTANLNAACGCVITKRLNDAKAYLKKAGDTYETRYVANVIRAMEGDVRWKIENSRLKIEEN